MVCGTKLDMAPERGKKSPSTVAAECGADEILIVKNFIFNYIDNCFNHLYFFRIVTTQNH